MKKHLLKYSLILLPLMALSAYFLFLPAKKEAIKIGAVIALSGPGRYLKDLRDAMVLAVDEINALGGVNGRALELIVEDSRSDAKAAEEALMRIEHAHSPVLYVSTHSCVSMALAPLAQRFKVPLVGLVVSSERFSKQGEWVFRFFPGSDNEVRPVLSMLRELKVRKIGVLYMDDEMGRSFLASFVQKAEKLGGTVQTEPFQMREADFSKHVEKLKEMEAVYVLAMINTYPGIFKEFKKQDYRGRIFANSGSASSLVRSTPESEGVYVAAPVIYNPSYVYARDVGARFESRYQRPFNHHPAAGYDFVKLLASLLDGREVSRENIRKLLDLGFVYPGILGDIVAKQGEHEITFPLYPARIMGGEIRYKR